jgi:hypothetical protein
MGVRYYMPTSMDQRRRGSDLVRRELVTREVERETNERHGIAHEVPGVLRT